MQAILRRLQHRGVGHRQRRHDRTPEHLRRVVPRQDVCPSRPYGFAQDDDVEVVQVRDLLAVDLCRPLRRRTSSSSLATWTVVASPGSSGLAGVRALRAAELLGALEDEGAHLVRCAPVPSPSCSPRGPTRAARRAATAASMSRASPRRAVSNVSRSPQGIDDRGRVWAARGGQPTGR